MKHPQESLSIRSINRHLRLATAAIALLVVGGGGLAMTTELSGAILAQGSVVVDGHVKEVKHPAGGVVEAILVRNGVRVTSGDVLLRLDQDVARADLGLIDNALDALFIRMARLQAERDGAADLVLDGGNLSASLNTPRVAALVQSERAHLLSRLRVRESLKAQLFERIAQIEKQVDGLLIQTAAQQDSIDLIQEELDGLEELFAGGLVTKARMTDLRKNEAEAHGVRGQLVSERGAQSGRIAEIRLQILQIDHDMLSEVSKEIREVEEKTAELSQRRIGALEQLERTDIRAPHDGIVHELEIHTVGGVVSAGERIMLIVPEDEKLSIEVKVAAQDRDQLHVGQDSLLRMSSFNQRTTPELSAKVGMIGADLVEDPRSGFTYYPVRLLLEESELERLGDKHLSPGMPTEAYIQTGYRSIFSYLTKPLADYFTQAFRSD